MNSNKKKIKSVALIPVRLNSTRLFKKALLEIDNIPMVVHTYRRALLSKKISDVYICTDSNEIIKIIKKYKCKYIKTGSNRTGTDRISEASNCCVKKSLRRVSIAHKTGSLTDNAIASKLEIPNIGTDNANANALVAANPTRTPVKLPGPLVTIIRSRTFKLHFASLKHS